MAKEKNFTLFAYGTNISKQEMLSHSESALFIGYGQLLDYELKFRGFPEHAIATLDKRKGATLPIAIYDLAEVNRFTIDNFEKFPYAYTKEKAKAIFNGKILKGYVYILKKQLDLGLPNHEYLKALRMAYFEANFDDSVLDKAITEVGGIVSDEDIF